MKPIFQCAWPRSRQGLRLVCGVTVAVLCLAALLAGCTRQPSGGSDGQPGDTGLTTTTTQPRQDGGLRVDVSEDGEVGVDFSDLTAGDTTTAAGGKSSAGGSTSTTTGTARTDGTSPSSGSGTTIGSAATDGTTAGTTTATAADSTSGATTSTSAAGLNAVGEDKDSSYGKLQ